MRPILDMRNAEDIRKLKAISEETFELVVKYKGSWSGEHGDGLVRSYKNEEFFGPKLYGALKDIKRLFDPENILNPGKITDAQEIDENLRYGAHYKDQAISTQFNFKQSGSFENTVHLCSGVGECRKHVGTMCPSYHATMDEEHSTRGRANALRLAMSGQLESDDLSDDRLWETMDLCLSCKACKSECPSNVDMAKLKSEVQQIRFDRKGPGIRDRFIDRSAGMARYLSGFLAPLVNGVIRSGMVRLGMDHILKLEKKRELPQYARRPFRSWIKSMNLSEEKHGDVVLFVDTYMNYHEPEIGIAAYNLLSKLGFKVEIADIGCCQRPRLSNGFLRKAKKDGQTLASKLNDYLQRDLTIVVCEPSCASALQDDLPDLIDDDEIAGRMQVQIMPLDRFVAAHLDGRKLKLKSKKALNHSHCHQKALYGTGYKNDIFGVEAIDQIDAGCCGMAGSFGYEKEHYELSEKIGSQRLFKAVNEDRQSAIVADGFSCRHQIEHFTGRKARHWVELVDLDSL